MDCGTGLVIFGLAVVAIAAVGYIVTNPQVLGKLASRLQRTQEVIEEVKERPPAELERPSSEAEATTQFSDLRVGEFVEFDPDPNAIRRTEYEVTGRGVLQALNRQGRNFTPRGEQFPLYVLDNGKLVIFERPDGWFVFHESHVLEGESAREFDAAGETFCDATHRQRPRSHSFSWMNIELAILDVGYLRYTHQGGKCHLTDGTDIKYMLAETSNGVLYLENQKVGTDRVWIGKALGESLNPYIGRVLRATA